jgi:hypothetical protein
MLYKQIGGGGKIDLSPPPEFTPAGPDSNLAPPGQPGGRIGDIGVTIVKKARYVHCDENGHVDRVFGFSDVLHEDGEYWELDQPYVDIVDANFLCRITGDRGLLRVESTASDVSPTEGRLFGNVVLHILPGNQSRMKEAFLYLDDITFVSERSHFSTAGPVRFVSADVRMVGAGLEGAYNRLQRQLEYLRITDLHWLRIKSSQAALFGAEKATAEKPRTVAATPPRTAEKPSSTTTAKGPRPAPKSGQATATQPPARHYQCLFADNVIIDAPEQLVIAEDEIAVINILFEEPADQNSHTTARTTDANAAPLAPAQRPTASPRTEAAAPAAPTPEPAPADPNQHPFPPDEDYDITVTCDNGILAVPMDSSRSLKDFAPSAKDPGRAEPPDRAGRTLLVARKIDYDAVIGSAVALGPVELTFDVNDPTGDSPNAPPAPVRITAQKAARFLPDSNQVIFEGGTVCTMIRRDPNGDRRDTLSAPTLTVDLLEAGAESSGGMAADVRRITAGPENVSLSSVSDANGPQRAAVELKCRQFEYDTFAQMFGATGPGLIKIDNSNAPEPNEPTEKFSFRRRCYALVQNFQTLQYYLDTNRLVADAGPDAILDIGYVPVIDANYGQAVKAGAGRIEALFDETPAGEIDLSALSATGGITYDDGDKDFQGDRLFYDAGRSLVTVLGAPGRPCQFKGTPVDAIQWDPNSNRLSFEIPAPGTLPLE